MDFLAQAFFARDAVPVARDLLGATVVIGEVSGRIVETEAYCRNDPASHSFRGRTKRNAAMFGEAGSAYVYQSYGIHWCLNVVCLSGDAVLFRALQPLDGIDTMVERRGTEKVTDLCSGPGKLGQALSISPQDNARLFQSHDFCITAGEPVPLSDILSGPRIGISQATGENWRFGLRGSAFLSRSF